MVIRIVVAGVAGAGKSSVAERLAAALHATFIEGDELHPPENVARMASGIALTDADRRPWLEAIRERLASADRIVVTCSALRRDYRDVLRHAGAVRFVFLALEPALAHRRLEERPGHFMGPGMVASQFETLEPPGPDESDVTVIDASASLDAVVDAALRAIRRSDPPLRRE